MAALWWGKRGTLQCSFKYTHYANFSQKAGRLNEHLEYLQNYLEGDKETARHLKFKVQWKNHGDRKRLLKFAHYSGPDEDTLELLHGCAQRWFKYPDQFWNHGSFTDSNALVDPHIQIFKAFVETMHDHA